jgi:hypothetical protein
LKHGGEARFLAHPQSGVTIHYYSNATSSNTFDSGEVRVLMAQSFRTLMNHLSDATLSGTVTRVSFSSFPSFL